MRILVNFSEGKLGNPEKSEDLSFCNEDFAMVVDGATNVTGKLINGKAPGRLAAELIQETVKTLPAQTNLEDMLQAINKKMQQAYFENDLIEEIEKARWMAPSASLIVYSKYFHEIWQIGDCQLLMNGKLYKNEKEIDSISANARSMFLEAEIKKGKTIEELLIHDTGWEYIQPLIQQQYYLQNDSANQYGFAVVNGYPIDLAAVNVIKVPVETEEIILASDGYPSLKSTLEETEECLRQTLQEDPLCFRQYKSSKGLIKGNRSFDDRLYLKIQIM